MLRVLVLVILYPRDETRYSIEGVRKTLKEMWPVIGPVIAEFNDSEFNQLVVQLLEAGDIDITNADITLSPVAKARVEQDPLVRLLKKWLEGIDLSEPVHPR